LPAPSGRESPTGTTFAAGHVECIDDAEGVAMKTLNTLGWCAIGAALLSAGGCNRNEREPHMARSQTTSSVDMAPASRTRSAAEQIARARCEREQECGNIGNDRTFSSAQDCLARIQNDWKEDLNARQCPGGINQHELNECLEQVRAESCSNPFDTLARITECTSGQICIEQP
jgi:hypothetical protein